jgi:RNA polymerase sigma-70 factor (ECF subfamily)
MADLDLVSRAAGGDVTAFQSLVERHRSMVYRVAYQFAGNHHDAEDIAQDVFVKVFTSLGSFRGEAQLTSWLYRITMNCCVDHSRRRRAVACREDPGEALVGARCLRPAPESQAYGNELDRVVEDAVRDLPPRQRLVFVMRHYEGLKLSEIAAALGLQEGTVKRQLHAAVRRLRTALQSIQMGAGVAL